MRPAVTVVIPAYDAAAFLPRAIAGLRAQDCRDWEAVVVDDGSRDGTAAVCASLTGGDPAFRVVGWDGNRGLGAALNGALDLARAPVVAYLPADDVWFADHLDALLAALRDPSVVMATSGVRHHGDRPALDAPEGFACQLVQVAHRRTGDRWVERAELESDDLDRLMWDRLRLRGRVAATGRVTCEWTDHPAQRHKAIRESYDGGLNVFRSRYRVGEPLRFHSTDSGTVDEVERYRRFRERRHDPAPDGLHVLLVGELAFHPERVLALVERGHRLSGLWTSDGLGDSTVGPLPFGHVRDVDRDDWPAAVRADRPDVVLALLNWRAVPFAHAVRRELAGLPFGWLFKESPQRSIARGEWALLADLVAGADACLLSTAEERAWFEAALAGRVDPQRLGVLDGDLPKAEWFSSVGDSGTRPGRLSERDGAPHTVVLGRPSGLDEAWVAGLARRGVHVHLHGQVAAPGPKGAWQGWLPAALAAHPEHVHLHDAVGPQDWARVLPEYDAGWLHRFRSANGGDVRRATWDDLNAPARLAVLLGAGLPLLQRANPGHLVAAERLLHESGAGLFYDDLDSAAAVLHAEVADRRGAAAAAAAGPGFTFDAHADRLVGLLRHIASPAR